MGTRLHVVLALLLACALSSCAAPASVSAVSGQRSIEPAPLQVVAAAEVAPAIVELRAAMQDALPQPVAAVAAELDDGAPVANSKSVALIVRWEVGSPALYTRKWERPVWPGGASGVTWGIGYDGGQATRDDIARAWHDHPKLERLLTSAGVSGTRAKYRTAELQDVVTPYPLALSVFKRESLPAYSRDVRRTFGRGVDAMSEGAIAAIESEHYNRGGSMGGDRNREKRVIRDECVPARDSACVAAQLRSMKRLWPDVRGLINRREDEARTAEGV